MTFTPTNPISGKPETYCDVCGRRDSWGCGHSGSQRRDARRHKATRKHQERRCDCYDHVPGQTSFPVSDSH